MPLAPAGGRGEAATYDAGDADDARMAKAARKQVASKSLAGGAEDDEDNQREVSVSVQRPLLALLLCV